MAPTGGARLSGETSSEASAREIAHSAGFNGQPNPAEWGSEPAEDYARGRNLGEALGSINTDSSGSGGASADEGLGGAVLLALPAFSIPIALAVHVWNGLAGDPNPLMRGGLGIGLRVFVVILIFFGVYRALRLFWRYMPPWSLGLALAQLMGFSFAFPISFLHSGGAEILGISVFCAVAVLTFAVLGLLTAGRRRRSRARDKSAREAVGLSIITLFAAFVFVPLLNRSIFWAIRISGSYVDTFFTYIQDQLSIFDDIFILATVSDVVSLLISIAYYIMFPQEAISFLWLFFLISIPLFRTWSRRTGAEY